MKEVKVYLLLYLSLTSGVKGAYTTWTPIDAQSIVCRKLGAPGQATVYINVTSTDGIWADRYTPHIITFYRTSVGASNIQYGAVDSTRPSPKAVIGTTETNLIKVPGQATSGGRRLAAQGTQAKKATVAVTKPEKQAEKPTEDSLLEPEEGDMPEQHERLLEVEEEEDFEMDERGMPELEEQRRELKRQVEVEEHSKNSRRRRGGSSSGGGSRRRTSSWSSSPPRPAPRPPPPPVYPKNSKESYIYARRRTNPQTDRRRGAALPTGVRRRQTSPVDNKAYSNPTNPKAGNYGYGSTSQIQQNFPSGYNSASYGYTGGMAHKKTSTAHIAMAATGGFVGGMGASYLYRRWARGGWGWRNAQCRSQRWSGSDWVGPCSECQWHYSNCRRVYSRNAARDDIMGSGFIPADFIPPIKITFYQLTGDEFQEDRICPPAGYNFTTNTPAWTPPEDADIFVTLTAMTELEESLEGGTGSASFSPASRSLAWLPCGFLLGIAAWL